ncbi:hypothetical protein OHB11_37440 [Streptomyces zaomyceticus]|uniref:YqeB family protein n=1 Tax=Streptomyces zaomyceticus TaxID=68286 RepID=UPI002E139A2B|nr:hypothetical protein OG237_02425 [Streptomyces zaomyceticus]
MDKHEVPVTVRLPGAWLWGVVLVGAGLGVGAAFAVGPVADWMIRLFDGVPGPLKLVAALPLVWSLPVLTLVGALAGAAASASETVARPSSTARYELGRRECCEVFGRDVSCLRADTSGGG